MTDHLHDILCTAFKGIAGMSGGLFAVILPWQEQMEWATRMVGAVAGAGVAVLTFISLAHGIKEKMDAKRQREEEARD